MHKWVLDVPEEQIICRINDCAWNIIIEQTDRFRAPPGDSIIVELSRPPESGDWWEKIIEHEHKAHYYISALIRHPIPDSWVVDDRNWGIKSLAK